MITLKDGDRGKLLFIGELFDRRGLWYGIELRKPQPSLTDGAYKGHRYFVCRGQRATFVRRSQITSFDSSKVLVPSFVPGDRLRVVVRGKKQRGTLRVVAVVSSTGSLRGARPYWGVEMDRPVGNSDGTHYSVQYFSVRSKMAIFVSNTDALHSAISAPVDKSSRKKAAKLKASKKKTAVEIFDDDEDGDDTDPDAVGEDDGIGAIDADLVKLALPKRSLGRRRETLAVIEFIGEHEMRKALSEELSQKRGFNFPKMMKFLHRDIIGQGEMMNTPFGKKQVIYCDWASSGRQLLCIERYLLTHVSTTYANTHTTTSVTGTQSTKFFHEARELVAKSCGCDSESDEVIFCEFGATGAIDKVVRTMRAWVDRKNTIVFTSGIEHDTHQTLWMDNGFEVVRIPPKLEVGAMGIDTEILAAELEKYKGKAIKIGCFVAAATTTGIIEDVDKITRMMHEVHGGFAFWDYSVSGPYTNINMSNADDAMLSKDAVFISTHKFLGGTSTPGVLVAKKSLFRNPIPVMPAGGTVSLAFGMKDGEYFYHTNIHEREEGGTPDIIGAIRAGLCFSLKDQCGVDLIEGIEFADAIHFTKTVLRTHPNIMVLGDLQSKRLPIYSMLISHMRLSDGRTRLIHWALLAKMLNQLFGIQARAGMLSSGGYIRLMLGLDDASVELALDIFKRTGKSFVLPGVVRLNFHYTITPEEFQFVCDAITFLAENAWKLAPLYRADPKSQCRFVLRESVRKKLAKRDESAASAKTWRSLDDLWWDTMEGVMRYPDEHIVSETYKSYRGEIDRVKEIVSPESLGELLPTDAEIAEDMELEGYGNFFFSAKDLIDDVRAYAVKGLIPPRVTVEQMRKGAMTVIKPKGSKSDDRKRICDDMLIALTNTDMPLL
jgi:selenocysteine lyase/cysteine desulfurase